MNGLSEEEIIEKLKFALGLNVKQIEQMKINCGSSRLFDYHKYIDKMSLFIDSVILGDLYVDNGES